MPSPKLKIIFFGTSDFAVTILRALVAAQICDLPLIITQPDEPVGRHKLLTPPPVKKLAEKIGLPTLQPEKLDDNIVKTIKKINADLFIVAAYGKIIPEKILNLPALGCLNIHPSLLPQYRGPSPIQYALLHGDQKTGISLMLVDKKMDHGPIISQIEYPIDPDDNYETLSAKLAAKSAELLLATLPKFISGELKPQGQNHSAATFTKIITKQDGQIDWQNNAQKIYNQWRAFYLWPNIFSLMTIKDKNILIKFNEIRPTAEKPDHQYLPGQLFTHNKKLLAACGEYSYLEVIKLQPEGKKIMSSSDFIHGYLK
ncbi:MAG TPA: methionyl-tRNA formyltransferase [Patescibacteria group bacterium]|nr:methionyl-tRNA formyltransferase [Patescibacteria group bacterium]